jgi:hypothetical protein
MYNPSHFIINFFPILTCSTTVTTYNTKVTAVYSNFTETSITYKFTTMANSESKGSISKFKVGAGIGVILLIAAILVSFTISK